MKLFREIGFQLLILARNQIITISLAITLVYLAIFLLINFGDHKATVLTFFIFNDPAIIGLFFVGTGIISDKKSRISYALQVTPSSLHIRLLGKVLSVSLIGVLCAFIMVVLTGVEVVNWLEFFLGNVLVTLITSSLGMWLSAYTDDFMKFLLRIVPIVLILGNGVMINFLHIYPITALKLSPFEGSIQMIGSALGSDNYDGISLYWYTALALIYISLFYWMGYRAHRIKGTY